VLTELDLAVNLKISKRRTRTTRPTVAIGAKLT
jgi:hypothetical protein